MSDLAAKFNLPANAVDAQLIPYPQTTTASAGSPNRPSILILIPALEHVHTKFMMSVMGISNLAVQKQINMQMAFNQQKPWATARNALAEEAIKSNRKYALWLDSDVIFENRHLEMLIDFMENAPADVGAITGIYFLRMRPHVPIIYRVNETKTKPFNDVFYDKKTEPYEIDRAGLGFCLMRIDAIKKVHAATKGVPFYHTALESEDMYFFRKMQDCGMKLFVHPKVLLTHDIFNEKYFIQTGKEQLVGPAVELGEFLKEDPETVYWKMMSAPDKMRKEITDITTNTPRRISEVIDRYFKKSDLVMLDDAYMWAMIAQNTFIDAVGQIAPAPKKILVLHSGVGESVLQLSKRFPDAGIDFWDQNEVSMKYATWRMQKRARNDLKPLTSETIWKGAEAYDLVFAIAPLGSPEEVALFVEDAAGALKPGGRLAAVALNSNDKEGRCLSTFLNMDSLGMHPEKWCQDIYVREKLVRLKIPV